MSALCPQGARRRLTVEWGRNEIRRLARLAIRSRVPQKVLDQLAQEKSRTADSEAAYVNHIAECDQCAAAKS